MQTNDVNYVASRRNSTLRVQFGSTPGVLSDSTPGVQFGSTPGVQSPKTQQTQYSKAFEYRKTEQIAIMSYSCLCVTLQIQ